MNVIQILKVGKQGSHEASLPPFRVSFPQPGSALAALVMPAIASASVAMEERGGRRHG